MGGSQLPRLGDPGGNGRQILGVGFIPRAFQGEDRDRHFVPIDRFDVARILDGKGTPIQDVRVEGSALKGRRGPGGPVVEGTDWVGATFVGLLECTNPARRGERIHVNARIESASKFERDGSTGKGLENAWTYRLQVELKEGNIATWTPACHGTDEPVVPVRGFFRADGAYDANGELLSFACTRRCAAKCENLGYMPDESGKPNGFSSDKFVACVRMLRADYCGDGVSFTTDGLDVLVWDESSAPAVPPEQAFEAAWSRDGASCIHHARWAPLPDDLAPKWAACRAKFDANNRWCSSEQEAREKSKSGGGPPPIIYNSSFVPSQAAAIVRDKQP